MGRFLKRVIQGDATVNQARDTGMAIVLVLLLIWLAKQTSVYVTAAIIVHVINMAAPKLFKPAAVLWFGFAEVLGTVMSRLILSVIFFTVVTPIGLARKAFGADALRLKAFKAHRGSVMVERNKRFVGADLDKPY